MNLRIPPPSGQLRPAASFRVGVSEQPTVEVFLSLFTGLKIYSVDGVEVLRTRSLSFTGARRFEVGEAEKHAVEIKVNVRGMMNLLSPNWTAEAYVDGELVVPDLFQELRTLVATRLTPR